MKTVGSRPVIIFDARLALFHKYFRWVSEPGKIPEETMSYNVSIDTDKCTGCGECVDVCPVDVFEMQDGKSVPVNYEDCLGCESCVEVCSFGAVTVEEA